MNEKYIFGKDWAPYNLKLIQEMYDQRICGIPVSYFLLDLRKTNTYCHMCADVLAMIIPGSNRVTGDLPEISGKDKSHSWVEKDNVVFDTSQGIMWDKECYYRRANPSDIRIHTREEVMQRLARYLKYTENQKELYVAWSNDIEDSLDIQPYRKFLQEHVTAFRKEKKLDVQDYNVELVKKHSADLQDLYRKTEEFLAKNHDVDDGEVVF